MASLTMTMPELSTRLACLGLDSEMPDIPAADLLAKPLDIFRSHLANLVASALGCDVSLAYDSIRLSNDLSQGDLELVLPKLKLKDLEPSDVVQKLQASPLFATPYADGPIIRFLFAGASLPTLLFPYIEDRKASYGEYKLQGLVDPSNHGIDRRKKVVVEFSSPNVGKEFNGHHLRSTLIGAFASNIYACMGWDVVRLNYLGDWGKELALLAIGFKKFGSGEALQSDPTGHMLEVFTKVRELIQPELDELKRAKDEGRSTSDIEAAGLLAERDSFFKNLEAGDGDCTNIWRKFRDLSIEHLDASYKRLGITFDEFSGESRVKPETMAEVEAALKEQGVLDEADGSWVIDFEKHGGKSGKGLGTHTIRSRNGSTTYLLRDIAAAIDRAKTHSFDKMIYVVSFRQDMHFQQVFLALKLMKREDIEGKLQHISFGEAQCRTEHFQKPLLLGNILDEYGITTKETSGSNNEANPETGGVTQHKGLLSLLEDISGKKRAQMYTFNPEKTTSTEEEPSTKLQEIHERLDVAIAQLDNGEVTAAELDYSALEDESILEILGTLARYPETTAAAFKSLEPHTVLAYLNTLATALADHFDDGDDDDEEEEEGGEGVKAAAVGAEAQEVKADDTNNLGDSDESPGGRRAKLEFYRCARQVLANGITVLGAPLAAGG